MSINLVFQPLYQNFLGIHLASSRKRNGKWWWPRSTGLVPRTFPFDRKLRVLDSRLLGNMSKINSVISVSEKKTFASYSDIKKRKFKKRFSVVIEGSFGWSLAGIRKYDNKDNYFNTGGFICFLVAGNVNNANLYFISFQVALCLVVRAHRGVYIRVKHSLFVSITKTGSRRIIRPIYLLLCDLNDACLYTGEE